MGPRGAPRAPLPRAPGSPRARCFLARPLPLARPILLAHAASSRTRGSRPAGRKTAAGRREVRGHCFAARVVKGGLRSKLSAAAGGPRVGRGAGDPQSGRSHQPGPALSVFSFTLVSPPTARGRGEGCGRGHRARTAPGRPRTPRPQSVPEPAPRTR